jgi:hypothetical protein
MTFDYQRWRKWLEDRSVEPQLDGVKALFRCSLDTISKPNMEFGLTGQSAIGSFVNWATGECDYTIMAPPGKAMKIVSYEWKLLLTNETFEAAYEKFSSEFTKHNV